MFDMKEIIEWLKRYEVSLPYIASIITILGGIIWTCQKVIIALYWIYKRLFPIQLTGHITGTSSITITATGTLTGNIAKLVGHGSVSQPQPIHANVSPVEFSLQGISTSVSQPPPQIAEMINPQITSPPPLS